MLFMSCVCHTFTSVHAALWSPVGKGLTSWLLFVMFDCVFVTFPCGMLGQVWYLTVMIHDLCHLSYFVNQLIKNSGLGMMDCISRSKDTILYWKTVLHKYD